MKPAHIEQEKEIDREKEAVTATRVDRKHRRSGSDTPTQNDRFTPIRIRGGSISDTVLGGRR